MSILLGLGRETSRDWGVVTALPAAANIGDYCTFKVAAEVYWRLVKTTEETYPWVKLGGSPLRAEAEGTVTFVATSYTAASGGPELIAPLKGRYRITVGAVMWSNTASAETYMAPSINEAAPENSAYARVNDGAPTTVSKTSPPLAVESGKTVKAKYKSPSGANCNAQLRYIEIDPVRVG